MPTGIYNRDKKHNKERSQRMLSNPLTLSQETKDKISVAIKDRGSVTMKKHMKYCHKCKYTYYIGAYVKYGHGDTCCKTDINTENVSVDTPVE